MAVGNCRDLRRGEVDQAIGVGEEHEVVAGSVALGEMQVRQS